MKKSGTKHIEKMVLIQPASVPHQRSTIPLRYILTSTDLTLHGQKAVNYALVLARYFCAKLTLFHICTPEYLFVWNKKTSRNTLNSYTSIPEKSTQLPSLSVYWSFLCADISCSQRFENRSHCCIDAQR